ncbi:MAG: NAD(P)H-hydrate epimerase [Halobacteriaceae archaeon]
MAERSFRTVDGIRVSSVTAEQMRAVDRVATEDVGLGLRQMMENAGRTLAAHVCAVSDGPVVVVAGNGGNGGGGLACARHLANRGVDVTVALDRDPENLTGAAARQFDVLTEMDVGTTVGTAPLLEEVPGSAFVDTLVGYGLSGAVREPARSLIDAMNRRREPVVSLDVPSGIDATSGEPSGIAIDPDRTVTLALPKTGLADSSGPLFLADIGVPETVYRRLDIDYETPFRAGAWVELRSELNVTE